MVSHRSGLIGHRLHQMSRPVIEKITGPVELSAECLSIPKAFAVRDANVFAVDLERRRRGGHDELHHPWIDQIVGEPFVFAGDVVGLAEFDTLEIDVVETEDAFESVEEALSPNNGLGSNPKRIPHHQIAEIDRHRPAILARSSLLTKSKVAGAHPHRPIRDEDRPLHGVEGGARVPLSEHRESRETIVMIRVMALDEGEASIGGNRVDCTTPSAVSTSEAPMALGPHSNVAMRSGSGGTIEVTIVETSGFTMG